MTRQRRQAEREAGGELLDRVEGMLTSDDTYGQTSNAVRETFLNWRMVDKVRECALNAAVAYLRYWEPSDPTEDGAAMVKALAIQFERYLTGEEADGQS